MPQYFEKKPTSTRNYTFDWGTFLDAYLPTVVTIASATVTVPTGLTKVAQSNTTRTVVVKISGGAVGDCEYAVVCTITMDNGEIEPATMYLTIVPN
jgi:hypothetical protein